MYCWKLKKIIDIEDNINDLHICIDRTIMDSIILKIQKTNNTIELPLKSYPLNNPKHLDLGHETSCENYIEEIIDFKTLQIKVNDFNKEITISFFENFAKIELSKSNLKRLIESIKESRKLAYIYDNYIEAKTIITNSNRIKSKIIIWAGENNDIVYC